MPLKLPKSVVAIAIVGIAYVATDGGVARTGGDPVVTYDAADMTMTEAETDARRLLPRFLDAALDDRGRAMPNAMLKVAFPVATDEGAGAEVVWVGPFAREGDGFTGRLANTPRHMPGLAAGDEVAFGTDMIRDWSLPAPGGRAWGHYTTRVIAGGRGNPRLSHLLSDVLMPRPAPADW